MRTGPRLFLAVLLSCVFAAFAQTNPPPSDPHEMVTRQPRTLSKPPDRSAAIDLLDRARKNFDLSDISTPYSLKVSFETNGAAQMEGLWTMEDFAREKSQWRWSAQLQDFRVTRISTQNHVYGTNPSQPIPLRVQLVRSVLLTPVVRQPASFEIRAADVQSGGKTISCLLLSYSLPPNPAPRSWAEREDCIDPATGLLQMWSEAPGIFALYDYSGAAEFHGHMFPRQIDILEDGRLAVQIRVESLEDAPNLDPNLFVPTPEMVDAGESFALASPSRQPLRVDPSDAPTSSLFQSVIVHATVDAEDGTVHDAEALQTSDRDLTRAALDLVNNSSFDPSGFQQEIFVNVQFHMPALKFGGPPIFHSSPHWIIRDRHVKPPRAPKPPRTAH